MWPLLRIPALRGIRASFSRVANAGAPVRMSMTSSTGWRPDVDGFHLIVADYFERGIGVDDLSPRQLPHAPRYPLPLAASYSACHLISAMPFPKGPLRQETDSTSVIEPGAIPFAPLDTEKADGAVNPTAPPG